MPQTPRVFISYARKDGEDFAADLVRRIEEADIPVWRDRDGLLGGEGWWSQIDYVLDQVEFMVVVMTPSAHPSRSAPGPQRHQRRPCARPAPPLRSEPSLRR